MNLPTFQLGALWLFFGTFCVATMALAIYGFHLLVLLYIFRRKAAAKRREQAEQIQSYLQNVAREQWPAVTSQIPIYNEADVAVRVMEAVAAMDYPRDRHEIQVLDDSTDQTATLIDETARRLAATGVDVKVIRRPDRKGYKAGALERGVAVAKGRYIAVFDADFVPPVDFVKRAVPLLEADAKMACLQGRWDHLNRDESWLTKCQALGIDGHFAIEQGARAWNGLMMNFNGTAGIWRKEAIDDPAVGGWSGDTLTEDLDLSYRAQLAGWRLDYCLDLPCPAELPGTVEALKSQQRRWATGSIQVACKLLPRIWRAPLSLAEKLEATLHLTHYTVSLWMLMLALVARPMLLIFADDRMFDSQWIWLCWSVILVSAMAPSITYAYARYSLTGQWSAIRLIPCMLALGCGLCLNNAFAVVRGLFLRGGEFVRTPKSGSVGSRAKSSSYRTATSQLWLVELMLAAYSMTSFVLYISDRHRVFSVFLLLYAVGFGVVGWYSRPARRSSGAALARPDEELVASKPAALESPATG